MKWLLIYAGVSFAGSVTFVEDLDSETTFITLDTTSLMFFLMGQEHLVNLRQGGNLP